MAITLARTGDVHPISDQLAAPNPVAAPPGKPAPPAPLLEPAGAAVAGSHSLAEPAAPLPTGPAHTPVAFRGFASPAPSAPPSRPAAPTSPPHGVISLGAGVPVVPQARPTQGVRERAVRFSTAHQAQPHNRQLRGGTRLPTVPDSPPPPAWRANTNVDHTPSPSTYEPFRPRTPPSPDNVAGNMEAHVAELVFDSHHYNRCVASPPPHVPVGDWIDVSADLMATMRHACVAHTDGTLVCDADLDSVHGAMTADSSAAAHAALLAYTAGVAGTPRHGVPQSQWLHELSLKELNELALRADSPGAPNGVHEALARGGAWPAAVAKELSNHAANGSWEKIPLWQLPPGRRLNKLVWVSKEKRDGTAKMRLCVQGCTMVGGIDYEQTFSSALRTASARTIFAAASRYGLHVQSVDLVAAYLQGKLTEGEEVYCHLPPGSEEKGFCIKIIKPIYGMPQAGRRLQRLLVPWMTETMGLRRLSDSDDCVYVYDPPTGSTERFICGIYVDNLQIATSVGVDDDGKPLDPNSFYARFMAAVDSDWDVVDEGEMTDLLSIQVRRNANGSITLHMENYIETLLAKYQPDGPSSRVQQKSMPYTSEFEARIAVALSLGSTAEPHYPELVKPYQQRLGSLMYLANACRPDLAFCISKHCTCMGRPTPDMMKELDQVFSYLSRHKHVGLTYDASHSALQGMTDADWGERFSTSGWVIKWQGAAISWGSKKQDCVALSTCEAEIIALSEGSKDMVYFRKMVNGIDASAAADPPNLATDNKGAQDTSYNSEHHSRMKHVKRRHFFVRDMVESFELRVPLVSTVDNYADFLTKSMKNVSTFLKFRAAVMNEPPHE